MSWMPLDYAPEPKEGEGRPVPHLKEVIESRKRRMQATQDRIARRREEVRTWLTSWRSRASLSRRIGVSVETIRRDLNSMDDLERSPTHPARFRIKPSC